MTTPSVRAASAVGVAGALCGLIPALVSYALVEFPFPAVSVLADSMHVCPAQRGFRYTVTRMWAMQRLFEIVSWLSVRKDCGCP
jgi:hypothetical protein